MFLIFQATVGGGEYLEGFAFNSIFFYKQKWVTAAKVFNPDIWYVGYGIKPLPHQEDHTNPVPKSCQNPLTQPHLNST